jgi:hypothetical protein
MLASQAAVALDNAQWSAGLEQKVAERTWQLEQRVDELAIINSVQQGISASLDFQQIVNIVGDKLREVLQGRGHRHPVVRPRNANRTLPVRVRARQADHDALGHAVAREMG